MGSFLVILAQALEYFMLIEEHKPLSLNLRGTKILAMEQDQADLHSIQQKEMCIEFNFNG